MVSYKPEYSLKVRVKVLVFSPFFFCCCKEIYFNVPWSLENPIEAFKKSLFFQELVRMPSGYYENHPIKQHHQWPDFPWVSGYSGCVDLYGKLECLQLPLVCQNGGQVRMINYCMIKGVMDFHDSFLFCLSFRDNIRQNVSKLFQSKSVIKCNKHAQRVQSQPEHPLLKADFDNNPKADLHNGTLFHISNHWPWMQSD